MNYPEIVRIREVVEENPYVKSIFIPFSKTIEPGQFIMVLIPGVDEIPMSVSRIKDGEISFTFKRVGDATKRLFEMERGDVIGVRGPLGNGFELRGERILFVGGGTGIAPLLPAAEKSKHLGKENIMVIGAKTKDELFFVGEMKKLGELIISTDDGSEGEKGLAADVAERIIDEEKPDMVVTCGPELMMKRLLDICVERGIDFQASVERYIKCALGLCGQCCIGEGLRVCKEGPVFDKDILIKCRDFGVFTRDASGRREYFG